MDNQTLTPHGRDMDTLKHTTRGTGVPVGRSIKAVAKSAAKDKASWDSAFHADRGCLSCGLPLKYAAPLPRH